MASCYHISTMSAYTLKHDPDDLANAHVLAAYSDLTRRLLVARGITNPEDADRFLAPDYERDTHDPFLLIDMERAVERISSAVDINEHIAIYSDYDADGIPGAVVLYDFFQYIGYDNVEVYIPHRHDEGFGVHIDAVNELAQNGAALIITIDCGIADGAAVEHAASLGIDMIITDHHEPPDNLPPAYAVVDPKRHDCTYPEKVLCGAGVIYKVVQALIHKGGFGLTAGKEKWLLDMVGLATCADMVPLTGENRVLASYGLLVLRKSPRPGVRVLCRDLRIAQPYLTEDDIGYMIAPRINAASRMGVSMVAFSFLAETDEEGAVAAYRELHENNERRKGVVASMVKTIRQRVAERDTEGAVVVAGSPEWKPSLLGLAANALVKECGKPVFLWGRDGNEMIKGSCRSDGSVHMVELMEATADVFVSYGGHEMAGGFSVTHNDIHTLEERLSRAYDKVSRVGADGAAVYVDALLPLNAVTEATYQEISRFAPFGVGNEKPLFRFDNVHIERVRMFGKQGNHIELLVTDGRIKIKAIGFFMKSEDYARPPIPGETVTVIGNIEKSYFAGRPEIRLRLVDII